MYSNSSDLPGQADARRVNHDNLDEPRQPFRAAAGTTLPGMGASGPLDLSSIAESSIHDLSYDLASPHAQHSASKAGKEPSSPRDRYLLARDRDLRSSDATTALLPKTSRLGPGWQDGLCYKCASVHAHSTKQLQKQLSIRTMTGPWHYESLVSTTRKSLTRSPCFSPRLSPIGVQPFVSLRFIAACLDKA